MTNRRLLAACVASSAVGMLFSAFIHSQWASPSIYSDIGSLWGRDWVAAGQLPYASSSTFLEYPPVSGLVLFVSRTVGGLIASASGSLYSGYYLSFSALSILAAAALAWSAWRLARALGVEIHPLYFLLPSMLVYGVYNFDLFDALFIVLSLQLFVEKRRDWSAVVLGVAVATKLVAGVLAPVLLLELVGAKARIRYLCIAGACAAAFFLPIVVFNPGYFGQFASFYSNWGMEDAWYIWIFGDPFSRAAKAFGVVLLVVLLLRIYTLKMPLVTKSFLAISAYFLSTYIYAPQFDVTLVPLVAVLAITSPALYTWEVFNAMIILTWFSIPNPTYPWTVPQTMALLRSASLAVLSLSVAATSGHSVVRWLRIKRGHPVQLSLD